ncbi:MAG: hypothetical protein DRN88_04755, partial [Candidatus Hydrothermarchaeota archaeon]
KGLPIAIAIAGAVDKGVIKDNPNLPKWAFFDLSSYFNNVIIENDANAAAFAEWFWRERNTKILVCITIGTGIGSGVIINGEIYKGRGVASELGHMVIDYKGERCKCGNVGCFETLASSHFIERRAIEEFGKKLSPEELTKLAKNNEKAREIFNELGRNLGIGLSNISNIFDPELIVLAGGITKAYKLFKDAMLQEYEKRVLKATRTKIKKSELGELAGVLGVAALYFTEKF